MDAFWTIIGSINGMLFSDYTIYALLISGVAFTIWSGFGQYYALVHGTAVVRGKYDNHDDPGAISHFQALSTALSATVGLGNIGGVAVAVALGGPGAVFWMWIIGLLGMSLKMTEVTQSMMYRDTTDPENPHGGPMYVIREGLKKRSEGLGKLGAVIGGVFVLTLITSAVTGGNMFQAWIVANISESYFGIPEIATGIVLTVLVGAVIIGGIKRIGKAAGIIVPGMCAIYFLAALFVLGSHASEIPAVFSLIISHGLPEFLGGVPASASGAFVGASVGYAMMWGVKRALFSSEAGQGSAPIAHAAAKSDEPVREGIVSGLEPFIDTIVVCTMTALVILVTGAWDRAPEASLTDSVEVVAVVKDGKPVENKWTISDSKLSDRDPEAKRIASVTTKSGWKNGDTVFLLLEDTAVSDDTQSTVLRLDGEVKGNEDEGFVVDWGEVKSGGDATVAPTLQNDSALPGVYVNYASATLTAHAFDRATPGLGKWLVTLAAWLFALSTMISWSYYGEKGIVYLFGDKGVMPYKLIYCLLIVVSCMGFIKTDAQLDAITTLGLGVMLVANIPIMWIFASESMKAYHSYIKELKAGKFDQKAK